jgi:hypothetical protein
MFQSLNTTPRSNTFLTRRSITYANENTLRTSQSPGFALARPLDCRGTCSSDIKNRKNKKKQTTIQGMMIDRNSTNENKSSILSRASMMRKSTAMSISTSTNDEDDADKKSTAKNEESKEIELSKARKFLAITEDMDAIEVQQRVNKKKMLFKGDEKNTKEVDRAYDLIQTDSFNRRLRLGAKAVQDKSVINADQVRSYWQPKWSPSPNKDLYVNYGIALACFIVTAGQGYEMRTLQVTIFGTIALAFRMFIKLVDVDPGPNAKLNQAAATKHNNMRFARSFVFCVGGFALCILAFLWFPNLIIESLSLKIPLKLMLQQELIVSFLSLSFLSTLVSFYK